MEYDCQKKDGLMGLRYRRCNPVNITGHDGDATVAHYTKVASQRPMADPAIAK
jgi:hypothetical protein